LSYSRKSTTPVIKSRFSLADLTFYRKQYIFYLPSLYIVSPKTGFELQQKIRVTQSVQRPVFSYSRKSIAPVTKSRFYLADLTFYRKQYIFYLPSLYTVNPKTGFELQQKIRFTQSAQRPVLSYSRKSTTPVTKPRFSLADLTFYRKQYIFYLPSLYIVSPKTGFELQKLIGIISCVFTDH